MSRKDPLVTDQYYQIDGMPRFSDFIKSILEKEDIFNEQFFRLFKDNERCVDIFAYCLMPTHIHLLVRQRKDEGISRFMANVLNSYTRYFNVKIHRKGPLRQGRFKSVRVQTEEQLYHLTRYIHLNPVTAGLVDSPEEWFSSSYAEYVQRGDGRSRVCHFEDLLHISVDEYIEFVKDQIAYQRELARVKHFLLE